jgi:hypothetical protein
MGASHVRSLAPRPPPDHPRAPAVRGALGLAACLSVGCGGGAPLLHPAHVLRPGFVHVGAGVSGQLAVLQPAQAGSNDARIEELTAAPGVAPWLTGRVGIAGDNEAGITFTGRSLRVDGRHAFSLGAPTLSVGLGASALVARPPGHGSDAGSVYGAGFDLPVLLGIRSRSDIYAIWIGPRAGVELFRGSLQLQNGSAPDPGDPENLPSDVSGHHEFVGGVIGMRAGFRHVHVAIEGSFTYHLASGKLAGASFQMNQFTITPGGALLISF